MYYYGSVPKHDKRGDSDEGKAAAAAACAVEEVVFAAAA